MGFLKFLVWTAVSIGLGMYFAGIEFRGKTTVQYLHQAWSHTAAPSRLESLKGNVGDALENAKDALVKSDRPHEHHSSEDRDAVNKLIAKRGPGK